MKTDRLAPLFVLLLGLSAAQAEVKEVQVQATAETSSITGDADDPAIWVNPSDPAASLVLGTDKYNGLHVFDLKGAEVAFFNDGSVNNVDLRPFTLQGRPVWLASATEGLRQSETPT